MNGDLGTSDGSHATTTINEQGRILSHYLKSWNFVSAHLHLNTETSSHTYESESNSCISTIDHFLCPQHCLPFFSMCSTLSNLSTAANTSDHIPLVSEVTVPVQVSQPSATHSRGPTLNWKKLSDEEINSTYTQLLESKLSTLSPPNMDICRENPQCLDKYLQSLCETMLSSSQETILTKMYHKHRYPGWNPTLNAAHRRAKNAWHYWKRAGKPSDPLHPAKFQYKKCKREFRKLLCKATRKQNFDFFRKLDIHASNSEKLFRLLRTHSNTQPAPTEKLVFERAEYQGDSMHNGWADFFERLGTSSAW